ncbi:MAG: MBL fold metallo-hydrolase, partial [Chloroflexaceae bacterium]|nr:MBL fold metallo-hydrolase [Chloroflexaceae bacterium]
LTYGSHLIQLTKYPRLFPVNCYLVREDDGFTLIDTAISGSSAAIIAAAQAAGAAIVRIALTHAHLDHAGSLDALHAALPQAEVLVGTRESRLLARDFSLDAAEAQGAVRGSWSTCSTRPTRLLHPGDRVGSLEVVAAPGHTPGHIAFFDTRDRSLVAGDAFQTRGAVAVSGSLVWSFPFPAMATWDGPTALASARNLLALRPSRLAVGHGEVVESPLDVMKEAIRRAEAQFNKTERHAKTNTL